jgi:propionyl-CoA carboxylase alpha chain
MCAAAVAAGRALAYHNAGTVEFVVDAAGDFYFLEVNTRLQVEHPVTEEVTGLDLVRLQILVAQDEPLPLRQDDVALRGHAIEARVYAEDPRTDFLPSTGTLAVWEEGRGPGIRWESGVETGSEVSIHYDPMLAKVIAHAPTRTEALARLARALATTRVHGVRTNVPVLLDVLRHPEFAAGRFDTHFIGTHVVPNREPTDAERAADRVHAVAAALWLQERRRAEAPVLRGLPSGWRNNPSQPQEVSFRSGEATIAIGYRVRTPARIDVNVDGAAHEASVLGWGPDHIAILLDGVRRACRIATREDVRWVHSALGSSELHEVPRFPPPASEEIHGGCRAPMPGRILAIRCAAGERVTKGQVVAVLEAMKMEHEVRAPEDGVVSAVPVEPGQQVNAGDVLVLVDAQQEEASA